jgi:PEP-CTERM motif
MRKKSILILAVALFAIASSVRADEKMNSLQTALSSTTISGYDTVSFASSDSSILMDSSTFAPSEFSASFSPSPAPEPSTIGLFSIGLLALIIFVRVNRGSPQSIR